MNVCKYSKINIYRIESNNAVYEIFNTNILGQSSNSVVYLGRCISSKLDILKNNNLVAIKKIMLNLTNNTYQLNEIDIIKEIMNYDHPNIIKCYDVIEHHNIVYIVMEYCRGGDLSQLLKNNYMKEINIKYYFKQIIDGMKFLHEKNIIHRDIKPKNILISDDKKTIKICDFGFAKQYDINMKRVSTVCGSPLYMAPEIYQKTGYTNSADVWSLGIILYEMIFGKHPFSSCNDINTLMELKIDYKNIKSELVSNDCIDLLKKMLISSESDRIDINDIYINKWINSASVSSPILDELFENKNDNDECDNSNSDSDDNDIFDMNIYF